MCLANRFELAPPLLVAVDFVTAACIAVALLPVGIIQAAAPILVSLVIYASGEYSLLVEARTRLRAGVAVACVLLMVALAVPLLQPHARWILPLQWQGRLAGAALAGMMLAAVHYSLRGFLVNRSQRYILHLRTDMQAAGESLRRHIMRSGYPARVEMDEGPELSTAMLPADVINPRADSQEEPRTVRVSFDPVRFCDVVLRALPPAVLVHRRDYVCWEAAARRFYDVVKRVFDLVSATVLLALGLPFMLAAGLGIAFSDGRPVLFRQVRVGRYGERFSLLKFRTLREHIGDTTTPNDGIEERVFRFGAFLRQMRLDELPQLLNVIKGDMSLIGPRPEMEYFHERWAAVIPFYKKRLLVRPGMSGWAQVRFTHTTNEMDYWDKTAYDLWYIKHRNIVVDARICLRTVGVILFGFGAR
jgi:lipopolysaccharide/colanic/teichoic acid biosynthesis glycosyltransferase